MDPLIGCPNAAERYTWNLIYDDISPGTLYRRPFLDLASDDNLGIELLQLSLAA